MKEALVSIGLPVFNGEKWIKQSIESLIGQTYSNTEIIIADDCSIDNTAKICQQFSDNNVQIQFIQNKKNLGGQGNFEKVLSLSSGKYFLWASQDDYWHKEFLQILVNRLENNPDAVLCGCAIRIIRKNKSFFDITFEGKNNPENQNTISLVYRLLIPKRFKWIKNNLFLHGVIRTDILRNIVKNIFKGTHGHDRHFILFLVLSGKWLYENRILYFRRSHVGMQIKSIINDPIWERKRNIFNPFIGLAQITLGLILFKEGSIFDRIFSFFIAIYHSFYKIFLKPARKILIVITKKLIVKPLKVILPERVLKFIKKHNIRLYY